MPSTSGSGPWFELCPEHVPAGFLTALSGTAEDASSHAAHAGHLQLLDQQSHNDHDEHECPFGHLLASAAAIDPIGDSAVVPAPLQYILPSNVSLRLSHQAQYRSRAPPA
ncbi:hypothetical protein BA177_17420 [Woeseia oceani]|uniref:DUF2946 domain-containing protein n=1 Tax=Woeseia oceani TaxID=1548547 RepID=A0A193LJP0_9GAMM|nr:hypothetical protein BA177_17420 [Woeseia oceani]